MGEFLHFSNNYDLKGKTCSELQYNVCATRTFRTVDSGSMDYSRVSLHRTRWTIGPPSTAGREAVSSMVFVADHWTSIDHCAARRPLTGLIPPIFKLELFLPFYTIVTKHIKIQYCTHCAIKEQTLHES